MTDPIADFLTRIRNAAQAKHKQVDIPASNLKKSLTHILYEQGYLSGYTMLEEGPQGTIKIYLKYNVGVPAISGLERISTPGLRKYASADELPRTLNGLGITIVSTPRGLMSDAQARREHVGGELLCRIW
ncbi:MAG: 30S ribosomal protein S8 [Ignavibacteria bacterium]|nr:30S ribosomal protein S8 [Ignavibacteria bacterium]